MYTLLSGLYKYMFQRDEYCVLILGLDNAGKTVSAVYHPVEDAHNPKHPPGINLPTRVNLSSAVTFVMSHQTSNFFSLLKFSTSFQGCG